LEWSDVDVEMKLACLHADRTKNGKALVMPLNEMALAMISKQKGNHPTRVFTYRGSPIKQINTKAWRRGLKVAGLERYRWHDLRHSWASWMVQAGVSLLVLQELGGWETPTMVRKYAHLNAGQLAFAAAIETQLVRIENLSY
jgi:integrase